MDDEYKPAGQGFRERFAATTLILAAVHFSVCLWWLSAFWESETTIRNKVGQALSPVLLPMLFPREILGCAFPLNSLLWGAIGATMYYGIGGLIREARRAAKDPGPDRESS